MTANRTAPPLGSLLAALLLADVLRTKRAAPAAGGPLPDLAELFGKDFAFREGQEHHPGSTATATAAPKDAAAVSQNAAAASGADEDARPQHHVSTAYISPELAALVGLTPSMDPKSLEGDTRLLAAALIANVRKLGAQAVNNFPAAGAKLSGIRFVENTILSALHTFSTLEKQSQ